MARRTYQLMSLSFLDILCGALGAIMFLFIIVDKGGGQESPPPAGGKYTKVYLDYDSTLHRFHGELPDSILAMLDTMGAGGQVLVVINSIKALPTEQPYLPPTPCDCDGEGARCPDPKAHTVPSCPDIAAHKQPPCPKPEDHKHVCPDESVHGKLLCDDPKCGKSTEVVYKLDPIQIPYKLGFSIQDDDFDDDVDLQICGTECVPSDYRKEGGGLRWVDMREGGLFKSARTGGELVLMEDKLRPGEYTIKARFEGNKKNKSKANASVAVVASTKSGDTIKSQSFSKQLQKSKEWTIIGKVRVDANGNITKS